MLHPCLRCGACCAHFRVAFHWSEAESFLGGEVPAELTVKLDPHRLVMRGTESKPVGTVWLALLHGRQRVRVWKELFSGDRHSVRAQTVRAGLEALCDALEDRDS